MAKGQRAGRQEYEPDPYPRADQEEGLKGWKHYGVQESLLGLLRIKKVTASKEKSGRRPYAASGEDESLKGTAIVAKIGPTASQLAFQMIRSPG